MLSASLLICSLTTFPASSKTSAFMCENNMDMDGNQTAMNDIITEIIILVLSFPCLFPAMDIFYRIIPDFDEYFAISGRTR